MLYFKISFINFRDHIHPSCDQCNKEFAVKRVHSVWFLNQNLLGKKLSTTEKQIHDSERLPNKIESEQNTVLEYLLHIVFSSKDMQK